MIYRNSPLAQQVTWTVDYTPLAADIAIHFLHSECEILHLARVAAEAVADLQAFLASAAGQPIVVERSAAGAVLIRTSGETLMVTGKTADVLRAYIDCEVVRSNDRCDMTLRRVAGL